MHLASIYLETIWYLSCSNKSNIFHAITRARSRAVGRSENRGQKITSPRCNWINWSVKIGGRGAIAPLSPKFPTAPRKACWLGNDHWQNVQTTGFFFLWLIFLFSLDFSVKSRQEDATARCSGKAKGQLIAEWLLGVIDFPKNQRKIWQISALESKVVKSTK